MKLISKRSALGLASLGFMVLTSMIAGCGGDKAFTPAGIQQNNNGVPGNPGAPGSIAGISLSQAQAIVDLFQNATPPVGTGTSPTVGISSSTVARGSSAVVSINSPTPVQRIYVSVDQAPDNYLRVTFVDPAAGDQLTSVVNPALTVGVSGIVPPGTYTLRISTQNANGLISAASPLTVTVT